MSGRKLLIVLSIGIILIFNIFTHLVGDNVLWNLMDIPTHHPSFIDLRGVLTGLDAARLGYDPLYENPLDPYKRPVAYPRLWMTALGWTGLTEKNTEVVALILLAGYALALLLGLKGYNAPSAVWMVLVIFSPAALMCYRFANVDLVIFVLLALMLALEHRSFLWAFGLLELAAFLKLFPIVAFGYLLKEDRKRFLRLLAVALTIFIAYLVFTWQDTSWILGHAPKGALENYGVGVIGFRIYEITNSRTANSLVTAPLYILIYILMIVCAYFSSRHKGIFAEDDNRFLDAFRIGALIYLATFIQGNSFNYRFIFMVFTVPQMVLWAETRPDLRFASFGTLIFLIFSCWGMALTKIIPVNLGFALDEIANWTLFAGLFYLFLVSSPDWIRKEIASFFNRYRLKKLTPQNS